MRDALGPGTTLGYCTNVHAGATLDAIKSNLERHAVEVKHRVCPESPMGVGLWLPAPAARELTADGAAAAFGQWLASRGLDPFTINGFPYGDFHRPVVKHDVYQPHWAQPARLEYTVDLIHVMAAMTVSGGEASISTLPLGWRADMASRGRLEAAAEHLRAAAAVAAAVEAETGVLVHVDLEPEPGCALDRVADVVSFFDTHLLGRADDAVVRRHLRVCHDVCHAAVMFENQRDVLEQYAEAGIAVGKVQLSAALRVSFGAMAAADRDRAVARLRAFGEDRYLHQTTIRTEAGVTMHDDLPAALAAATETDAAGEWRVHYHVPVFLADVGPLATTAQEIAVCLDLLRGGPTHHFEVETYAWEVLPTDLRAADLAEGIAREIDWVKGGARTESAP